MLGDISKFVLYQSCTKNYWWEGVVKGNDWIPHIEVAGANLSVNVSLLGCGWLDWSLVACLVQGMDFPVSSDSLFGLFSSLIRLQIGAVMRAVFLNLRTEKSGCLL